MQNIKIIKKVWHCLYQAKLSQINTANRLGLTRHQVRVCKSLFEKNQLCSSLPDDKTLLALLPQRKQRQASSLEIDFEEIHHLKQTNKAATLTVLYEEWLKQQDEKSPIIGYSQFAKRYKEYCKSLKISMRSEHKPAECVFVDYSGTTIPIINQETGEITQAQIFVGVLGYSNLTYCEATLSQKSLDWNASHIRMFEFFKGVPDIVVPDNLKSAVIKADKYSPTLNINYNKLCEHYDICPMPARAYKPKDKAKAEGAVLLVQRWILFRLRKQQFFSLAELNRAILPLLQELNNKLQQKCKESRYERYLKYELPVLKSLPDRPYLNESWDIARVPNDDYHIQIDGSFYSVPYHLRGSRVEYAQSSDTIKIYYKHELIAIHVKAEYRGKCSTLETHMPENHHAIKIATPEYIMNWAEQHGETCKRFFASYLQVHRNRTAIYRFFSNFKKQVSECTSMEIEHICQIALNHGTFKLNTIKTISTNLEKIKPKQKSKLANVFNEHENLRGREHYLNK